MDEKDIKLAIVIQQRNQALDAIAEMGVAVEKLKQQVKELEDALKNDQPN